MVAEPVVQCIGAGRRYGNVTAVEDVSFTLARGEVLSILGPSGCGKTTLLRLIAGFEGVDSGQVRIGGRLVSGASTHVPPDRRGVGMVFQEYALFPHMTVAQNVAFGLQALKGRDKRIRMAEVIATVRLDGLESRYPHEISGGQQQRVALARTIAPRPAAVLLDEPFSSLDAGMRSEMRREVDQILRSSNIATIFVTHDREEAFAMADRIGVMREGRIDQLDTPDAVYHTPETPFVASLAGVCDFLPGQVSNGRAETEIGRLLCLPRNGTLSEGARVELMVRPDDFHVVPDSRGSAVVDGREFRGDGTIMLVRTGSGTQLRCRQRSDTSMELGTRVRLIAASTAPFIAFSCPEEPA